MIGEAKKGGALGPRQSCFCIDGKRGDDVNIRGEVNVRRVGKVKPFSALIAR